MVESSPQAATRLILAWPLLSFLCLARLWLYLLMSAAAKPTSARRINIRRFISASSILSTAHPVSGMHAVAIAVRLVSRSPPDHAGMRRPGPSPGSPSPASSRPIVIAVRPHPARSGCYADGAHYAWRRRTDGHARPVDGMFAGRQRQDSYEGRSTCSNSELAHRLPLLTLGFSKAEIRLLGRRGSTAFRISPKQG